MLRSFFKFKFSETDFFPLKSVMILSTYQAGRVCEKGERKDGKYVD